MKWSERDLRRDYENVKASLEIEGLTLPDNAFDLFVSKLKGEITQEEFARRVMELIRS